MTIPTDSDQPSIPSARGDSPPQLVGRVGSLDAFWPLVEPVLAALRPRRLCEIGVDQGIFTDRLLAWGEKHGCTYIGIDPAPDPAAAERIRGERQVEGQSGANDLVIGRSLDALRALAPCEAYFIDGDHNYYTVRNELDLIERATLGRAEDAGPVIFAHDVSWPWARRDMYHLPAAIPTEDRHPYSDDLGVSLDSDELTTAGLRSQGRYSIALHAGGPHNGVLTAIEDFLASGAGRGWRLIVVPVAYGLAILYQPDSVPEPCRSYLEQLRTAAGSMGGFLESCEANILRAYFYSEDARAQLDYWTGARSDGRSSYQQLDEAYRTLDGAYKDLTTHSETLLKEFNGLLAAYSDLDAAFRRASQERDELQRRLDGISGKDMS